MNLRELYAKRRSQFWGEVLPYLGYVIQSGVAVVFLFVLIAFSAWYTSLVQNIPPAFPTRWIMLAVLFPLTVNSSVRTYLQHADTVFLLPQESRMNQYFFKGWVGGSIYKIAGLILVVLTLWPLYIRSDLFHKPLMATILVLIGLKLLSSYGSWKELSMTSRSSAAAYRALRWAVIGLTIASWLWYPSLRSLIFIILISAAYFASLAIPAKHSVAWERLIQVEKRQAGRVMMVLSWFVNVPQREQRVYARKWLSRSGRGIPWRKDTAYRYLLVKSLVRSDIFGILIRVGVLGALLVWWTRDSLASSAVYLVSLMIAGLQLSSLRKLHHESFWLHVYPLPEGTRRVNEVKLVFQVQLLWAVLMWLPLLASLTITPGLVLGTGVCGVMVVILFRFAAMRRGRKEDEDDEL
ncbi:ABC transporter permease [Paenibacillus sp. N3/727]|uniref:ABC transporter permease n=1 Tax=Paenibacillus sp. N3/727 TaxID=2925845 RepID=UPI001F537F47|nr:ABC transporter permease [Paenibacillus sp. N3/727]UNK17683.1 ABC transporter permease [Paenibacillus sp. N3/727]